ncbi:MAG: YciI family protein [Nocardiopsaceae bacterium]|jgi:hypothetical protein|nr:YciI family protein [Nocardiopsaceae bacterium]
MLLHYVPDEIADREEQAPEIESALSTWVAEMTGRGIVLHGDRLRPASTATTVQVRRGDPLIADGPFAETKEQVAGYDVIDCADIDEAIAVAAAHPTARLGTIEVRAFIAP